MNITLGNIRYIKVGDKANLIEVGRPTPDELAILLDLADDALHAEKALERFSEYASEVTDGKAVAVVWDLQIT